MKTLIRILTVIGLTTLLYSCGSEGKESKDEVKKELTEEEKKEKELELQKQREHIEKLRKEKEDKKLKLDDIVGKTEKEVEKVLGRPNSVDRTKYGRKLIYNNIEIVFIKGRCDWITLDMSRDDFVSPSTSVISIDTFDKGKSYEYTYIKCFTR